jgi:hypothetical protein
LQFAYQCNSFCVLYRHLNLSGCFLPDPYRLVMTHDS